jgi:Integrase core domain
VEAISRHRYPPHRRAVATASLPRVLDPALWPHDRRSSAHQRRDQGSDHPHGHCEPALGCSAHPWRAPQDRYRGGRAYRVPPHAETASRASQTWRTFLDNHVRDLVSIDFFTVPTARLRVLFVLVVLAHHRRRVVHFNVTEHPTAVWTAQQMVDAFPDDSAPAYLLRDRDQVYGQNFRHRVQGMGIDEVLTAPHSPWQNPFAERLIGSIRLECLDHVVVLGERHLRRTLTAYFAYYHRARTHLSLDKDAPDVRSVEPFAAGRVVEVPVVGGLHHRYVRRAA